MSNLMENQDEGKPAQSEGAAAEAFKNGWDRAAIACVFWMMGKGMSDEDIDSFVNALKLVEPKP